LEFSPKTIEAQNLGFEVYLRREKYLLALKCLIAAHSIDPEQSKLHEQLIRFRRTLDSASKAESEKVNEVLKTCSTNIVPATSTLSKYNEEYITKNEGCARRIHSGLHARWILDPLSKARNEKDMLATIKHADMQEAIEGMERLKEWKSEKSVVEAFLEAARGRWPEASAFQIR